LKPGIIISTKRVEAMVEERIATVLTVAALERMVRRFLRHWAEHVDLKEARALLRCPSMDATKDLLKRLRVPVIVLSRRKQYCRLSDLKRACRREGVVLAGETEIKRVEPLQRPTPNAQHSTPNGNQRAARVGQEALV
jgi:hypothetical protein